MWGGKALGYWEEMRDTGRLRVKEGSERVLKLCGMVGLLVLRCLVVVQMVVQKFQSQLVELTCS